MPGKTVKLGVMRLRYCPWASGVIVSRSPQMIIIGVFSAREVDGFSIAATRSDDNNSGSHWLMADVVPVTLNGYGQGLSVIKRVNQKPKLLT
jgi:hypothetical protein